MCDMLCEINKSKSTLIHLEGNTAVFIEAKAMWNALAIR